jgi:two-component system osmolarity sensor histidine kinase EnvZ
VNDSIDGVIKGWSDISGVTIVRVLSEEVPKLAGINLALEPSLVGATVLTDHGLFTVTLDRRRLSPKNPHQLFVWMVAIGAVMIIISYMFLRNQLRPVKRLAVAAAAFGRGQVISLTPTGATEMRAAGTAFLHMRGRIERQAQQRRLMLSGISHDLRTPLTRMRLGLSLIEEDTRELEGDVDAMQQMLDAFLNFAIDEGTEETELVDLCQLITNAIQQGQRAGFDVVAGGVISAVAIPLRPMAIGRLLDNLISNGAKYGTRVGASLSVNERSVCITIEDDGPGIEPEYYDTALRPFTRLEGGRNQNKVAGVGLGLAIANDIVRSHGGTLRLGVSEALGGLRVDVVLSRPAPE